VNLDLGVSGAGIERKLAYVTNVVKHFKWRAKGKRRIHPQRSAASLPGEPSTPSTIIVAAVRSPSSAGETAGLSN
jgi:hypothetical protein